MSLTSTVSTLNTGNASITTTNTQSYSTLNINNTTTLNGNLTITSLTVSAGSYAVSFSSSGTSTISSAGVFNNAGGVTLSGGTFNFTNGLTSSASTTTLSGTVNTTNSGVDLGVVSLSGDSSVSTGSGALSFGSTVNSASTTPYSLTLTTSGTLSLSAAIGAQHALNNFTATASGSSNNLVIANNITTSGNISLTAGNNVNITTGSLSSGGNITLTGSAGAVQETGTGILHGSLLTTSSATGTLLNNANTVSSFSATNASSGPVQLTNTASTLTVISLTQGGSSDVALNNTGNMTLTGAINTGSSNNLNLTSSGTLSETGAGAINTNTLTTNTATGTLLNGANTVLNLNATNTVSGDIQLTDTADPLTINAITQSGAGNIGNVYIYNVGSLNIEGPVVTQGNGGSTSNELSCNGGPAQVCMIVNSSGDVLTVDSSITTGGGDIHLEALNPIALPFGVVIDATATLDTTPGTGGYLSEQNGVLIYPGATLNAGAGVIYLKGLTGVSPDLTLGTQTISSTQTLTSSRNIIIYGTITLTDNAALTLIADSGLSNVGGIFVESTGSIICESPSLCGGNLTLKGSSMYGVSGLPANTAVTIQKGGSLTTGGSISFLENLNETGNVQLNGNVQATGLNSGITIMPSTVIGNGTIQIGANLSTNSGAITLNAPVTLIANATLDTTNPGGSGTTGAAINFINTVNGAKTLTLKVGTVGDVSFAQAAGGLTPLSSLIITGATNLAAAATSITTTGSQSYSSTLTLGANTTLVSTNSSISLNGVSGGTYTLSLNNGSGATTLAGTIGAGTLTFGSSSAVTLAGASITTNNSALTFNNTVALTTNDSTINTGTANLTFSNTVDGGYGLTLNGTGTKIFDNVVGTAPISSLSITGATNLAAAATSITTTGSQTYNGQLVLGNNVNLIAGGSITIAGGINGQSNQLTLTGTFANDHVFSLGGTITFTTPSSNNITVNGDSTANSNTLYVASNDPSFGWYINGSNTGTVAPSNNTYGLNFNTIQNLSGGSAANTYYMYDGSSLNYINGGPGLNNTLDYSSYTSGTVMVDMSTKTASLLTSGFTNIQTFNGRSTSNSSDTFAGSSTPSNWLLTGANKGNYTLGGITYSFNNFPNLTSQGGDTFVVMPASIERQVSGGATPGSLMQSTLVLPSGTHKVNTLVFGNSAKQGCFSSGFGAGCLNDPINFNGFNVIQNNGSSTQAIFNSSLSSPALIDRTNALVYVNGLVIKLVGFDAYGDFTFIGNFQNILGGLQMGQMSSVTWQPTQEIYSSDNFSGTSLVEIRDDGSTPLLKKASNASSIEKTLNGISAGQDTLIKQIESTTQVKISCDGKSF